MPIIFRRNCNVCKRYYVGRGKLYCGNLCAHQSPIWRKNHSKSLKGKVPWNKGKILVPMETCLNCGKRFLAYMHLGKRKRFCSRKCSKTGKFNPNFGKVSPLRGIKKTPEQLKNFYESLKTRKPSKYWLGRKHSKETKEKISKTIKANPTRYWKGKRRSAETVRKMLIFRKPNAEESTLRSFLDKQFPKRWDFVGDGKIMVDGKNPDFVYISKKKAVIELFGEHWHKQADEKKRVKHFEDAGYKCLIIWTKELRKPDILLRKIKEFLGKLQ